MTITVSFQELKDYQEAFEKWEKDRISFACIFLLEGFDHLKIQNISAKIYHEKMDAWDKQHPMPKLIPDL